MEEVTETVVKAEASKINNALPRPVISASIEASLLARLDHLGSTTKSRGLTPSSGADSATICRLHW